MFLNGTTHRVMYYAKYCGWGGARESLLRKYMEDKGAGGNRFKRDKTPPFGL